MQVTATVRVKVEQGEKPGQARLEEVAKRLQDSGFKVLRIGRFGVSIQGEQSTFARVLGVDAAPNRALNAKARPEPALHDLIEDVEVAPEPQLY